MFPDNSSPPLLRAKDINLWYNNKHILRDINFEIGGPKHLDSGRGQIISLIGRNGIGKTTLFRVLAGLIKPLSGSVVIGPEQTGVKAGIVGIVPQDYRLFTHRTVYNNLRLGLHNCGKKITASETRDIIEGHARAFGMLDDLHKFPAQLSGGQRQRVSIIQQVLTGNKVILLDEPFSGIDSIMKDKVDALLLNITAFDSERLLFIVSHDIANTLALSDTALILAREKNKDGATITETIDLSTSGFERNAHVKTNHHFQDLVCAIKNKL